MDMPNDLLVAPEDEQINLMNDETFGDCALSEFF